MTQSAFLSLDYQDGAGRGPRPTLIAVSAIVRMYPRDKGTRLTLTAGEEVDVVQSPKVVLNAPIEAGARVVET